MLRRALKWLKGMTAPKWTPAVTVETEDNTIKAGDYLQADHPWEPWMVVMRVKKATDPSKLVVGIALAPPDAGDVNCSFLNKAWRPKP